jgi:hypothetical protein
MTQSILAQFALPSLSSQRYPGEVKETNYVPVTLGSRKFLKVIVN